MLRARLRPSARAVADAGAAPAVAREAREPSLAASGFEIEQPWHGPVVAAAIAVGLVAADQRGFYLLPNVRPPHSQVTPEP